FQRNRAHLDRQFLGGEQGQALPDPVAFMFEDTVSEPVPYSVRPAAADGHRREAPVAFLVQVAYIADLPLPVRDRVVRPGRQFELAAVFVPGIAASAFGDQEPEIPVRYYVGPRQRSAPSAAEHEHIFRAVAGKSANAVEKLQIFLFRHVMYLDLASLFTVK